MEGVDGGGGGGAFNTAPLRPLEDFLTGKARFQIPDLNNEERWLHRITQNLLYYQTNYFLSSFIIFAVVGSMHPQKMAIGILVMVALFGAAYYARMQQAALHDFKKQHPLLYTFIVFAIGYYVIYMAGSVLVFALGVLLPLAFVTIHASLRLRNLSNKVANAREMLGLSRKTPMAIFLEEVGIEVDLKFVN